VRHAGSENYFSHSQGSRLDFLDVTAKSRCAIPS
jgi:hypothetical protein